jgi:hypothetical protein
MTRLPPAMRRRKRRRLKCAGAPIEANALPRAFSGAQRFRESRSERMDRGSKRSHLSPKSLPVEVSMKCSLVQAWQTTGLCVPFGTSGASDSQCCTFSPVRGHLKTIWPMADEHPVNTEPMLDPDQNLALRAVVLWRLMQNRRGSSPTAVQNATRRSGNDFRPSCGLAAPPRLQLACEVLFKIAALVTLNGNVKTQV